MLMLNLLFPCFSGFVNVDKISSYLENRDVYSKKCRKKGFGNAVQQCDEFMSDPEVCYIHQCYDFQLIAKHILWILEVSIKRLS